MIPTAVNPMGLNRNINWRNFSTSPQSWTDFSAAQAGILTDDFKFEIAFELLAVADNRSIFGNYGQSYSVGIGHASASFYNFRVECFSNGPGGTNAGIPAVGKHTFSQQVVGQQYTAVLDGVVVMSWNAGSGTRINLQTPFIQASNHNGYIFSVRLINLTSNTIVYGAPKSLLIT